MKQLADFRDWNNSPLLAGIIEPAIVRDLKVCLAWRDRFSKQEEE